MGFVFVNKFSHEFEVNLLSDWPIDIDRHFVPFLHEIRREGVRTKETYEVLKVVDNLEGHHRGCRGYKFLNENGGNCVGGVVGGGGRLCSCGEGVVEGRGLVS